MVIALAATLAVPAFGAAAVEAAPTPRRMSVQEIRDEQPLDQLFHTRWAAREGLNGPVMGIAQTTDGYLWVGTAHGLFRFDGVRFERFESLAGESLQSDSVLSLHATPDNGLWVGFLSGGLSFVRDGHVLLREKAQGAFEIATRTFVTEKDGTLWVANGRALLKRSGDQWIRMGEAEGYPGAKDPDLTTMNVLLDGDGNLWVVTNRGMLVKAAGHARFVDVPVPGLGFSQVAVDPEGRVWATTGDQVRLIRLPRPNVPGDSAEDGHTVHVSLFMPTFDREGYLWYGQLDGLTRERFPTQGHGPAEVPPRSGPVAPPVPLVPMVPASGPLAPGTQLAFNFSMPAHQRLTPSHGLTGDRVLKVFQDRAGSIWIGTNAGLDRLRRSRVSIFQFPVTTSTPSMAAGARGDMWFALRNGMFRLGPAGAGPDLVAIANGNVNSLSNVLVDRAGTVWVGDRTGLWRIGGDGRFIHELPPDVPSWQGAVTEIAEDASGAIWIVGQFHGVMRRLSDGRWERLSGKNGLPRTNPRCITVDEKGRVWMGYPDGQLIRVEGDRLTRFSQAEGLRVGAVLSITARKGYLWIGGEHGVQRLDDSGFRELRGGAAGALVGVSGIVETPQGELWLNGAAGITRIEAADLRRSMAEPAVQVPLMQLDTLDGLPGRAETSWPLRTALQAPDGTLWFALTNGLVTVDPAKLQRSDSPPIIHVQHVMANGTRLALRDAGRIEVPAGTSDLQIDYTAMALMIPERVRFKYRLRGLEAAWHEAGSRRQAFYTNLGPGSYAFEVLATNEDGIWSPAPATLAIEIPPTFFQSTGFRALCALGVLLLLAMLARLRWRQLEARALERYRARLEERTRIAQDLHDTLLQGFQGLLLRFQRVARGIPTDSQARLEMERVLDQADEVVVEGRNRVADLRLPPQDAGPLEQTLEALGRDLSGYHDSEFRITVGGVPRALEPSVQTELALVAREALFNAFQHSKAARIDVAITYTDTAFLLKVSDNGVGLGEATRIDGKRPGHWGLSGMRERVKGVGGMFELLSNDDAGTDVVITLPAEQAYRRARQQAPSSRLRRDLKSLFLRGAP